MGMSMGGGGGPYNNGRKSRMAPMSEINVTPMVDVMLVLLVIFMVTAPLLTVGVEVDLPRTKASSLPADEKPLTVSIDAAGRPFIHETEVDDEQLGPRLVAITGANPEARIYVRGDKTIAYGRIMEVMGIINDAGFRRVALIAHQLDRPAADRKPGR